MSEYISKADRPIPFETLLDVTKAMLMTANIVKHDTNNAASNIDSRLRDFNHEVKSQWRRIHEVTEELSKVTDDCYNIYKLLKHYYQNFEKRH